MYDKKVAVVILEDLLPWQKMNVVAFLAGSVALSFPEVRGDDFVTADGFSFLPFIKNPTLVYKADSAEKLTRTFNRGRDRDLAIGIYTRQLFDTRSGEENIVEIAKHKVDDLDLVGIIIYGENKKVDKALDGLKFHESKIQVMNDRIIDSFDKQGMMKTLNAKLESVKKGKVKITCDFSDNLTQHNGYFHAGVITSLVDTACGYAALTNMSEDKNVLTAEFKINFLKPAITNQLVAIGKVLQTGKTLTICEGYVYNENQEELIAKMTATMIAV